MTVLVTGATGFLGSHLALALRARGVIATGRDPAKLNRLLAQAVPVVPLDLRRPVADLVRDQIGPVDAVIHCAGLSAPWGSDAAFQRDNVDATRHVLDLAEAIGARRFVHVSTASVYFRFCDQDNLAEDAVAPTFVNAYARTKFAAETAVLERSALSPIVLRPRGIYGAGDTALLPRLLRVAARGPVPRFKNAGATDITHVDDVVAACCAALDAGPRAGGAVLNISGGTGHAMPDIITAACAACDVALRWRVLPFRPALAAVRCMEAIARRLPDQPEPPVTAYALGILRYRQTLDLARASAVLGWVPQVSFAEGLERTFAGGRMRQGAI